MHVRLFGVVLLLVVAVIVMAVRQVCVVVLVGMPIGPMLKLGQRAGHPADMVVSDVIVIMGVRHGWMSMRRLLAFAFSPLCGHHQTSSLVLRFGQPSGASNRVHDTPTGLARPCAADWFHKAEPIPIAPDFGNLALGKPVEEGASRHHLLAGRGESQQLPGMRPARQPTDGDLVAIRKGFLDDNADIGESRAVSCDKAFVPSEPTPNSGLAT
jgi:hypothetical protein